MLFNCFLPLTNVKKNNTSKRLHLVCAAIPSTGDFFSPLFPKPLMHRTATYYQQLTYRKYQPHPFLFTAPAPTFTRIKRML